MIASESEASFGSCILNSLVGIRAVRKRLRESVEVSYKIWARGNQQRSKGQECTNAGNNPADILHAERSLCPRGHSDGQDDDQQETQAKSQPLTRGIAAAHCIASVDQAVI